jgi:hypothetical protein
MNVVAGQGSVRVDSRSFLTWMNSRKVTPGILAERLAVAPTIVQDICDARDPVVDADLASAIAESLDVAVAQIAAKDAGTTACIFMSADELRDTCRPIERDGIHFYNYYTMPTPHGSVGPVILDILCPAGRLPKLNNGHLEPALTVNLGPGDIVGRWAESVDDRSLRVLEANRGDDAWIVGASYLEPSYAPHSYALASAEPAQIVSYTAPATLAGFLDGVGRCPAVSARRLVDDLDGEPGTSRLLAWWMARRGYEIDVLARAAAVDERRLRSAVDGRAGLGDEEVRAVASVLAVDYRLLLPPERTYDALGRSVQSVDESRRTVRRFRSYTVASMATSSHLTDLTGLFMAVDLDDGRPAPRELDLVDHAATHYLAFGGRLVFRCQADDGSVEIPLDPYDSLWVAPFVPHRFDGRGRLLKFGSGDGFSYRDQFELSNEFASRRLVERSLGQVVGWGYDS